MGVYRTGFTDDEGTYMGLAEGAESFSLVVISSLAYSKHILGVVLHYILGNEFFREFKLLFLFFSYSLFYERVLKGESMLALFFGVFLWPYAYIAGTFLRDDLVVSLLMLIGVVLVALKNAFSLPKLLLLIFLLLLLYIARSYWAGILSVAIFVHWFFRGRKVKIRKKTSYLLAIIFIVLILQVASKEYLSYNFNLVDIFLSPVPWKIGLNSSGVLLYENLIAYWFIFIIKFLLVYLLLVELLQRRLRYCDSIFYYGIFWILVVQSMSILNGPRQTTILLGLLMMGFYRSRHNDDFVE